MSSFKASSTSCCILLILLSAAVIKFLKGSRNNVPLKRNFISFPGASMVPFDMKTEKRVPLVLEGGCLSQFYRIRILYDGLFTNGLYSPNGRLLLMSYMISGLFIHYGWTYWKIRMWSKLCLPSTLRNI
jgi:hypothetical protein